MEFALCVLLLAVLVLLLLTVAALLVKLLSIAYPTMELASFVTYRIAPAVLQEIPTVAEVALTVTRLFSITHLTEQPVNSRAQQTVQHAAARMFVPPAIITITLTVLMDAVVVLLTLNVFNVVLLNHHNAFQLAALLDSISAQETVWLVLFTALLAHQALSAQA
jgi:hypothetical protein